MKSWVQVVHEANGINQAAQTLATVADRLPDSRLSHTWREIAHALNVHKIEIVHNPAQAASRILGASEPPRYGMEAILHALSSGNRRAPSEERTFRRGGWLKRLVSSRPVPSAG
jgi:hypothetical protein